MEPFAATCPCCRCKELKRHTLYTTANHGKQLIYQCKTCGEHFSETANTFLAGIRKPISLIVRVFKVGTEGMGLNAVCRSFGLSKNTVMNWERRFAGIKQTPLLGTAFHGSLGGIGPYPIEVNQCPILKIHLQKISDVKRRGERVWSSS